MNVKQKINERISILIKLLNEEEGHSNIDKKSLEDFNKFCKSIKNLICPNITLTPSYTIYANWMRSTQPRKFISVVFKGDDKIKYVIFTDTKCYSGITSIKDFINDVKPYGANKWIKE